MIVAMAWERYEPPGEESPRSTSADPTPVASEFSGSYVNTGGPRRGAGGRVVGLALAGVAAVIAVGVGVGAAEMDSSDSESEWYACIAEYDDGEPGLLSPADLCDIGHDRPDDYVDDFEPQDFSGFGSSLNGG